MLTTLTVALLLTAGLAWGWWRARRALTAERARARLMDALHQRDSEALTRRLREDREVLAEASSVVDAAYRRYQPAYREGEPDV